MSAPAWTFRNTWMTHTATHAQMQPDNPAMRFRGETTTWAQLSQRSLQGAAGLAERGVTKGDRVAMLALNHPSFVEALLAINSAGAIAVPINFRLSPPEVDYILRDSTPSAIFVDAMLLPLLRAVPALADVATVIVFGEAPEGAGQESDLDYAQFVAAHEPAEIVDVAEDETALIMYTSGTTGRPKGAMLSHQNLQAQAVTVIRAFGMHDESDMGFITAPFFHIASLGSIVANLLTGIPFVVHPLGAFNATEVLDAYESEGATVVFNVPQQWDLICAEPRVHERDLKLRIISWGAAPASDRTLRAMADAFPDALNVAVFGQTETSPITCVLRGEESLRKQGSVGRPIPTLQYRVVDALMNDVAQGEVGEIVYRGPTVTKGYWNKPAETEDAFAGGWFHSGDLVRQDEEGFVWVVDRKKDMIISGGENIYCAEVENAISEIPSVLEVAVIGRPDDKWGQVPVAYVTVRPGDELTIDQLRSHLDGKLATYKMPKDLVTTDGLPRNAGGKIVKATLRTQDADTAS
ncbi:long-chain-fatty-acid--CoA ligase [Calidifontibacter indicus]|uniref:Fatty-acyl-CoA synthase n=1 Tax=Calidifontibacter indicus TaxID=419650 RepID=A0A3D9UPI4_9MICO|nr:long-chain-fatty-acid--CoA ligase [Calidifontibacter indicus]REF29920.1 fatty-acyl-CoA synthase [Calidifontibacter indicus]